MIRPLLAAALLAALFAALSSPAFAGNGTISVKDSNGNTQTFDVVTDSSGNFLQKSVTCDQSAGAQCASVTAANALKVDGSAVTQPVSGTVSVTALPAGSNTIGSVNQAGSWTVQQGSPPWSVSESGTWTVQPGNTPNTTPWLFSIGQGGNTAAVNSSGQLSVTGGGAADEAAFTAGFSQFTAIGGVFNDGIAALSLGQSGVSRLTSNRAEHINRRDSAGQEIGSILPGARNLPELVQLAAPFQPVPALFGSVDALGQPRSAAMLTDGQLYGAFAKPNTGAMAQQTALVAALSPNTPLPAGTNAIGAVTGTGSAGSPAAGALTVQGISGGTNLNVSCQSGCAGGPADESAFTAGATSIAPGGVYNDGIAALSSGQLGELRATANRAQHGNLRDSAGRELGASLPSGNPLPVQVALAPSFAPPTLTRTAAGYLQTFPASVLPAGYDAIGNQRVADMITDGQRYASLTPPFIAPVTAQPALVVALSPNGNSVAVSGISSPVASTAVLQDGAGRPLGGTLPSAVPTPLQVNPAPQLAPAQPFPAAPLGALTKPYAGPSGDMVAQVVNLSINPSLQCPFVAAVNQTASAQVVAGLPGKRLHVCSVKLISASQQGVSLAEGTGAACGTGTTYLDGGSGGTNQYAANGGEADISDRIVIPMQNPGDSLCVIQSGSGNVSGRIVYGVYPS